MNRYNTHPIIAKEGWLFILGGIILALLWSFLNGFVAFILFVYVIFAIQFFRDPKRYVPAGANENTVLSAADGKVIQIQEDYDPYAGREALKISVFMNVFNVHSNRVPVDGKVEKIEYFSGRFFNAALDKASAENERNAVVVTTPTGQTVTYVQIAGLVAKRILCYVKEGEELKKGERYGFIRFGSRIDMYLPLGSIPMVKIGDKVQATTTVLAKLQ
ncbi:phosphatidylserine decarboxylase [Basilea psittacipulmonis]|uniref:Phosphatidylserine decarboxylase proenzyme n=1 Tax=Basilea psittacipulmonis DSM 24701 TaxID=1072685 RepID=A0A077DEI5_9BURK|nr:phosphatidylserine decarboxylase [Basilea psittacipulmonis]AIL33144.1 phosphatidylserine decarboxylase [Basilea psittacipulmonis DSM 24701]